MPDVLLRLPVSMTGTGLPGSSSSWHDTKGNHRYSVGAYPKGVGHCRQQGDQATTNGPPGEDALLALRVVEKRL